ncbi:hypothetical protein [Fowl aviadenovirus C]|uniref:Uncharacterized protein n=1 Tax=Fowl aviadenovirus C TaxID=190063 RepID=A0A3G4R8T0_9ADEN|nr:hypothetical protein [Fowl aviadenovirus C]
MRVEGQMGGDSFEKVIKLDSLGVENNFLLKENEGIINKVDFHGSY